MAGVVSRNKWEMRRRAAARTAFVEIAIATATAAERTGVWFCLNGAETLSLTRIYCIGGHANGVVPLHIIHLFNFFSNFRIRIGLMAKVLKGRPAQTCIGLLTYVPSSARSKNGAGRAGVAKLKIEKT